MATFLGFHCNFHYPFAKTEKPLNCPFKCLLYRCLFLFLCSVFNVLFFLRGGASPPSRLPPGLPAVRCFSSKSIRRKTDFIFQGGTSVPSAFAEMNGLPSLGGDEQNRTVDPLLARQVLSQLSYAPISARSRLLPSQSPFPFREMVGPSGLEPPTSRLSVVRSSQLSYGPSSFCAHICVRPLN